MSSAFVITRGERQEYRHVASGKTYFSVSQVLEVLMPGTFDNVPKNKLAATRERGNDLHYWFAMVLGWKAKLVAQPEAPDGIAGYVAAMMKWADDYSVTPILFETPSCSPEYGFAGTVDTLANCRAYPAYKTPPGADIERFHTIVDLKSGQPKAADIVQIQMYKRLEGYQNAQQMLLLYVKPDGTYKVLPVREAEGDFAWFLNGVGVLQGRLSRGV